MHTSFFHVYDTFYLHIANKKGAANMHILFIAFFWYGSDFLLCIIASWLFSYTFLDCG
jgi:hypothetical protein